jgi:hypothetical protein
MSRKHPYVPRFKWCVWYDKSVLGVFLFFFASGACGKRLKGVFSVFRRVVRQMRVHHAGGRCVVSVSTFVQSLVEFGVEEVGQNEKKQCVFGGYKVYICFW